MTWVAPRTWVTGEVVTAAHLNEQIRDNELELRRAIGCKATLAGAYTIAANATNDPIEWDGEEFDTSGMHDPVTNNSRVTIPAGYGGYWQLSFVLSRSSGSGLIRDIVVRQDGATTLQTFMSAGSYPAVTGVSRKFVAAGSYLELLVSEVNGASLNLSFGTDDSCFEVIWAGSA